MTPHVYVTSHVPSGQFYVGVHNGRDPAYLGSGDRIARMLRKYPRGEFAKQIVASFDTMEEAYDLEAELVDDDLLAHPLCVNISHGGFGAASLTEEAKQKISRAKLGNVHSAETKKKLSKIAKGRPSPNKGNKWTEEMKKSLSDKMKGNTPWNKGVKHSEETKKKIAEANTGKTSWKKGLTGFKMKDEQKKKLAEKMTGKVCWNNGERNRFARECPGEGWVRGRL